MGATYRQVSFKLTNEELKGLRSQAKNVGMALAAWLRRAAGLGTLPETRGRKKTGPGSRGGTGRATRYRMRQVGLFEPVVPADATTATTDRKPSSSAA